MELLPEADAPHERCQSLLGAAVDARSLKSVQVILAHKGYEHSLGKAKGLCMAHAIESDDFEIVQALVGAKAQLYNSKVRLPNHIEAPKNNALLIAASHPDKFGTNLGHFGLFRQLISGLSQADLEDGLCVRALKPALEEVYKSGDKELFDVLRAQGVRVTRDMLDVCARGNEGLVSHLLEITTCENLCKIAGGALESASSAGHETIVRMLLHKYTTTFDKDGILVVNIALKSASADGHINAVSLLLDTGADTETTGDSIDQTPLNMACRYGHFVLARLLVEYFANIDGRGENGAQYPQQTASTPLIDAIEYGNSDIARWLIEEGADIHGAYCLGTTALWSACYRGDEIIAQMLIDRGADVNVRRFHYVSNSFQTALDAAEVQGYSAIVRLLKQNGAH